MNTESIDIQGFVTFSVYDRNGNYLRSIEHKNLVTTGGKNYLIKKIIGDPSIAGTIVSDIAVGDGSTAAAVSDTSLENEIARVAVDSIFDTDNVGTFLSALEVGVATGFIQEAGLYTNETTPTLVSRIVLPTAFSKQSTEAIQINWRFKIGSN